MDYTDVLPGPLVELNERELPVIKKCKMPIGSYLHEADNLYARVMMDLPVLKEVGMGDDIPGQLLTRTQTLRLAESRRQENTSQKERDVEAWKVASHKMHNFFGELLHNLTFAYRNEPVLLNKLAAMKRTRTHAGVIQGLNNLSVLGLSNQQPLMAIRFDLALLNQAADMSDQMGGIYARANGARRVGNRDILLRDKAFTMLKEVVDEVRSFGKFVFRKQPEKYRSYTSKYRRDQRSRKN